eukprot:964142-Prorocentrum_minimum.AAC.6
MMIKAAGNYDCDQGLRQWLPAHRARVVSLRLLAALFPFSCALYVYAVLTRGQFQPPLFPIALKADATRLLVLLFVNWLLRRWRCFGVDVVWFVVSQSFWLLIIPLPVRGNTQTSIN